MTSAQYLARRSEVETYFDRTAVAAWTRLTSDAPVGRIRATVRAGRDEMRRTLLSWLPLDLRGARILDAGCGTGSFSIEVARRGAEVVAVDISPTLIEIAQRRLPDDIGRNAIRFVAGDMLDPRHGGFNFVVAMDSFIHYRTEDAVRIVAGLSARTSEAILMTYAPRTPLLAVMHAVGRVFPRGNRAPAIEPVAEQKLHRLIADHPDLADWRCARSCRIANGFYTSQALELRLS
ncbi:magnesium protoporphyrin IX methyltransferase [Bradyrhizobium sp. SSBR45G]|uniref:magnesium protoporphyrin IX methyltransferase n=1 Tax=unclassified Bradyrhizobium TaxID=2631580 RepID=UPI002342AE24|nr:MULTISPECIES: magnesium protoporphyrin IX methyltransferase [unclassified Bradyrhizobium]GLH81729.1 magnesium protoporphyrin IX methyltransferase [Bradyrhizobium sp. SSBR45G]GLH89151.1 magnesium protoporphyrin IX methyltransferase [Bradyrhizobium sp. SSBR45R]